MFKRTALIALCAAVIGYAAMPASVEAAGYKSKSNSSSFRSSTRSTPKYTNQSQVRTPAATPYRGQSATDGYRKPAAKPSTPYGSGMRGAQGAPSRSYAPAPRGNTTVIQKNYYNGGSGYRGNAGNSYGGGYGGGSGGIGMGGAILGGAAGAVGGMMLMDALTEDEGEKALKLQQEQKIATEAKEQQARDDKQDQILEGQKEIEQNQERLEDKMIPEPSDDFFKINPNAQ